LTVDLDQRRLEVRHDPEGGGEGSQRALAADQTVIEVPAKALAEVPAGSQFSFLGRPGQTVYQLAQAVLGKHVHGEIDPHLWQNVRNVMAYVQLIRDTLIGADPGHAADYRANTESYLAELSRLDRYVRDTIAEIPPAARQLVTTHDAFGYLAQAYELSVAGFVTPNPAVEPSLADRRKLAQTLSSLAVPAVFLEPNLASRSSVLAEVAEAAGVAVCPILGDAFTADVTSYVAMMRFNAQSLRRCLAA
jgi:anchored repeat ABC transporter substrate-binding protein